MLLAPNTRRAVTSKGPPAMAPPICYICASCCQHRQPHTKYPCCRTGTWLWRPYSHLAIWSWVTECYQAIPRYWKGDCRTIDRCVGATVAGLQTGYMESKNGSQGEPRDINSNLKRSSPTPRSQFPPFSQSTRNAPTQETYTLNSFRTGRASAPAGSMTTPPASVRTRAPAATSQGPPKPIS